MNCPSFQRLSHDEQELFIGYLLHVVRTSEGGFKAAECIIEAARAAGKLDNVKIGHEAVYGKEMHY